MEAEENLNDDDEGDAGEEEEEEGDDITDYDSTGDGSLPMNIASIDDTTTTATPTTPSSTRKRKLSIPSLPSDPTTPTPSTTPHTPRTDTALATSSLIARFIQPNFPMFENKEKVWVVDAFGADNDDLMAYVNASAGAATSGGTAKGGVVKGGGGSATQAM